MMRTGRSEDPVVLSLPDYLRAPVIAADWFANDGEAREAFHGFPIDDLGKDRPPFGVDVDVYLFTS